jgi:hypothetical protein
MTIGPEDLTDDNGRLLPDVARMIQEVPDRPLPPPHEPPRPAAPVRAVVEAVPMGMPAPAAEFAPRRVPDAVATHAPLPVVPERPRAGLAVREIRIPVPDIAAVRVSLVPFVLTLALAAAAAGLVGMRLGARIPAFVSTATRASTVTLAAPPIESVNLPTNGTVSGINVNLRAGPGLAYSVVAKLQTNEPVTVLDQRTGWYSVSTSTGAAGWVFGAYVSGIAAADRSPSIVRRGLVGEGDLGRVVLRPGDRVLHLRTPDGRSVVLLPDGQRVRVEEGALGDAR